LSLLLVDQGKLKVMLVDSMTTHTHHIVYKSQGGSDDPSNLVEMDFIDHARLHAEDFLNGGPDFDFRHAGWDFLESDLQDKVREEKSRRQQGNGGRFGNDGTMPHTWRGRTGYRWWNNGKEQVRRKKCPGSGWVEGQLPESNAKKGRPGIPKSEKWKQQMKEMRIGQNNPCAGRRWVTDGVYNLYLNPGEEIPENFKPGRTL
jgi:hypothetical protein